MNGLSTFSGIGGLDEGLRRAGVRHVALCESDEWRRGVLRARFPGVPIYEDVRSVRLADGGRLPLELRGAADASEGADPSGVDLLCGGFPCQDLSVAGRRAGLAGGRSGLFFEFARIADAFRPRWLLIENVPGLLSSNGGRDFGELVGTLVDLGYSVAWRILDSRFFGVPQRRRRVFIVACDIGVDPRGERCAEVLSVGSGCDRHLAAGGEAGPSVAPALSERSPSRLDDQGSGQLVAGTLKGQRGSGGGGIGPEEPLIAAPLSHGSNPNSNMAGRRREDDENLVTVGSLTGGNTPHGPRGGPQRLDPHSVSAGQYAVEGSAVRRLTPVECERLQALPDNWTRVPDTAPDSRRYAALGDAVTASVAEWIGRRLIAVDQHVRQAVA